MPKIIPTDIPNAVPVGDDVGIFVDVSDLNKLKKNTLTENVRAGLSNLDTDDLSEGTINRYLSPADKIKLDNIQLGAQVNAVNSVNGQTGNVELDLGDIPNGGGFVKSTVEFTPTQANNINTAQAHVNNTNNPHNTTKAQVGLDEVVNERQLSREPGNFDDLEEKPGIQRHLDDLYVIQDSADDNKIKKITNKTDLIWKSAKIQIRGPSINYYNDVFVDSTTYRITSFIVNSGTLYYCLVSHQSSGSFASDLANGYRQPIIGSGTGASVTVASGVPAGPGSQAGDLYIDTLGPTLYFWNGANRIQISGGAGVNFQTLPTTGNKITFSVGTVGELIEETVISYDPTTDTRNRGGTTQTGTTTHNDLTTNYTGDNVNNFADGSSITNNLNGDVNNNYGATYVENNVYTAGSEINNEGEITINNTDLIQNITNDNVENNITGDVINEYTNYTEQNNYDNTSQIIHEGGNHYYSSISVTQINQFLGSDTFTGDGVIDTRGPISGRVPGSTVTLVNTTTGQPLVEGVDYTIDPVTGVITFTPPIPDGEVVVGTVAQPNTLPGGLSFSKAKQTANITGIYPHPNNPFQVFKNGLYMTEGATDDYEYIGSDVVFNVATELTDQIVFIG